jgi:hypothetical protein
MMQYRSIDGKPRRVHKEYVDVVARFSRDGTVEPVAVQWRDGRSFFIDEVLGIEPAAREQRSRETDRYRVRFGGHETDLFLERNAAVPALGTAEVQRWWVYAYDCTEAVRT